MSVWPIGILVFVVIIIASLFKAKTTNELVCTTCGSHGESKKKTRGTMGTEIVLWLFFLIPGLVYSIWRSASRHTVCGICGGDKLIPANSPLGEKLLSNSKAVIPQLEDLAKGDRL